VVIGKGVDAGVGDGRYRKDRRTGQRAVGQQVCDLGLDLADARFGHPVDLGEGDEATRDTENVEDRQMLAGLRHRAVIGGDHQQGAVDSGDPGQHVVDQPFMAGHVDEAQPRAIREIGIGKAEIKRHAALFLFRQTVGIRPCQGFDEQGLAVVDMPGGCDDHRRASSLSCVRKPSTSSRHRMSSHKASS
jgi:hypothetical protein